MVAMTRRPYAALALAAVLIAGCGSGAKTVTVESSPVTTTSSTPAATPTTPSSTTASTPASTTATSPSASADGGTAAPTTTRSAPEPAFAEQEQHAEGAAGAAAVVRSLGYTPVDTSEYHPEQTLRVLVGKETGSSDGYVQRAFFFLDGRYIGTDSKQPSARISVVSQGESEVTIAYSLYRHGDSLCCPSGGDQKVTFALNDGHLRAMQAIPPASSADGLSRE